MAVSKKKGKDGSDSTIYSIFYFKILILPTYY